VNGLPLLEKHIRVQVGEILYAKPIKRGSMDSE